MVSDDSDPEGEYGRSVDFDGGCRHHSIDAQRRDRSSKVMDADMHAGEAHKYGAQQTEQARPKACDKGPWVLNEAVRDQGQQNATPPIRTAARKSSRQRLRCRMSR